MTLQLSDPVLGFGEGSGLGQIVDDKGGLRVAVVHGREGGKALLAGRVPYLEFDGAGGQLTFLGEKGGCLRYQRQRVRVCQADEIGRPNDRQREAWKEARLIRTSDGGLLVVLKIIVHKS